MNDAVKKLLAWLVTKPLWVKVLSVIVAMILAIMYLFSATSCGVTRAVVHNGATGTTTEIKITTNNPTSVQTTPNVQLNPDK